MFVKQHVAFCKIHQIRRGTASSSLSLSPSLSRCIASSCSSQRICRPTEPLITFIELPCRFRSYSSIVPITANQSSNVASARLRQTSRRNQPIYRGTMGQHDSIVSRRLCINRLFPFFLRPTFISLVLRTVTLPLLFVLFDRNDVRGSNQTVFGQNSFDDDDETLELRERLPRGEE